MRLPPKPRLRLNSLQKQIALFLFSLFAITQVRAQLILVHEHENPKKRDRYFVGSPLTYVHKNGIRFSGYLESIQDSSIILSGEEVLLSEIKTILYYRRGIQFLSNLSLTGAVFYVGLDFTNALLSRSKPLIGPEVLPIGVALAGSGLILRSFRYNRRKVSDKRRLRVLDTSPN